MREHTAIKRLSALVLVLVMALPLTLPVMAAQTDHPYQINIRPNKYTSTPGDLEDEIKAQSDFATSYDSDCIKWAKGHANDENAQIKELAGEYINLVQRFKAFQIFKGDIDPDHYQDPSDNTSIGSLPANALANVQWGESVGDGKIGALLYALMTSDTLAKDAGIEEDNEMLEKSPYRGIENRDSKFDYNTLTLGDLFSAMLKGEGYTAGSNTVAAPSTDSDLSKAAALVAKVLSDFTPATTTGNPALARAFAKIVTEKNSSATGGYKYLNNENIDDYTSEWDSAQEQWTIGDSGGGSDGPLQGGYYLFTDTYDESHYGHKDKAQSELILGVFGTVTMTVKASAPSVDKGIVDDNNKANKGDTAEIGDSVIFRLTGTLAENYDTAYDEYKYIFHDTLSKGLTYGSVHQVYVKVYDETGSFGSGEDGDPKYDIYVIGTGANGYQEKKGAAADHDGTQHTVDFDFGDLKKLQGVKATEYDPITGKYTADGSSGLVPITSSSEIYVEYTATLNEDAVVGYNDNYNEVILEYSDNPENSEETNTSTGSRSYVYTFGVEIYKYDGSKGEQYNGGAKLKDAGFALGKDVEEKWYQITDTPPAVEPAEPPAAPQYKWIRADELQKILGDKKIEELSDSDTGKLSELSNNGETSEYDDWYLVFDDDGPKKVERMTYCALLKEVTGTPKSHYAIAGWVPETNLETVLGYAAGDTTDEKWTGAINGTNVKACLSEGFAASDSYVLAIKTDEDGYLRIEGMDSGIPYYLREVITPNGFDTIDPIGIQFTATYFTAKDLEDTSAGYPENAAVGYLKDLTYRVNGGDPNYIVRDGKYTDLDGEATGTAAAELSVKLEVANYPAGYLPGTGGRGVYLFYTGGVALLIGAAAYLIISNVKKKNDKGGRYITIKK